MTAFQPIVRTSNNWLHVAGAVDYTGTSPADLVARRSSPVSWTRCCSTSASRPG